MVALIRNVDNAVMNDRQGSDWNKKDKLAELQDQLDNLQPQDEGARAGLEAAIATLQAQRDAWLLRRREICAAQSGGVASDYSTVQVAESNKSDFLHARYITYDGENLTYDTSLPYTVVDSVITCHPGWVRGNERLLTEDVTDWSGASLTEPLWFELWYARNSSTQAISIQLLTRKEDEEFSSLPAPLVKIGVAPVCAGRVDTDNNITIGG